jgi:hypothetical protein
VTLNNWHWQLEVTICDFKLGGIRSQFATGSEWKNMSDEMALRVERIGFQVGPEEKPESKARKKV